MRRRSSMKPTDTAFIYGTAWKEDDTERLTAEALAAGFGAVDTANQRKHYDEAAVGRGIQSHLKQSGRERDELFVQTKFTHARGHDHRIPYDPHLPVRLQVLQSCESSLEHLQTDYIDAYLLHGPMYAGSLHNKDMEAWGAMEQLYGQNKVRALGIANVSPEQLKQLWEHSTVKPAYVQNRCFAQLKWDYDVRSYCREKHIAYQGFSLLTANAPFILTDAVHSIAAKYGKTIPQIIFCFCHQAGMICLNGTTSRAHMQADLDIFSFSLTEDEMDTIENIGLGG